MEMIPFIMDYYLRGKKNILTQQLNLDVLPHQQRAVGSLPRLLIGCSVPANTNTNIIPGIFLPTF